MKNMKKLLALLLFTGVLLFVACVGNDKSKEKQDSLRAKDYCKMEIK
jgi:hypothetical protein